MKRPQPHAEEPPTRTRIERAALDLFVRKGIDASTTREIAGAAGLSEGALYRHFASKEDIARTLFVDIHERLAGLIRDVGTVTGDLGDRADAIVDAFCETADADWTLFSFHLLSTAHFLPSPPGRDDPVSATEDILRDSMKRGEIEEGDAGLIAAMALGVVLQPALHRAHGRSDAPLLQHRAAFKAAVRAVLGLVPKAPPAPPPERNT